MRSILHEIFRRQFTVFDLFVIACGTQLSILGHWGWMIVAMVVGMTIGVFIERKLKLRIPRQ